MYNNRRKPGKTTLIVNNSYEGERIEEKIARILNNKEPITDGAPPVYTERSAGVLPETNIRTDRWDVALEAMDKVTKSHRAKREARIIEMKNGKTNPGAGEGAGDGGAKS